MRGLHKSKILPSHGAFFPNIKHLVTKIAIQFNNTSFVVKQNSYATYIAYIVLSMI